MTVFLKLNKMMLQFEISSDNYNRGWLRWASYTYILHTMPIIQCLRQPYNRKKDPSVQKRQLRNYVWQE